MDRDIRQLIGTVLAAHSDVLAGEIIYDEKRSKAVPTDEKEEVEDTKYGDG